MKSQNEFHQKLKRLMDDLVNLVYDVSEEFPKSELFGLTSQYRRAALSIILNYIEGFARKRNKVMESFFEISYGSLKEANYLTYFSHKRNYINDSDYSKLSSLADEIGAMLWTVLAKM